MLYTPENIDIDAFEKALVQVRRDEYRRLEAAKMKAAAYYNGYEDCISKVESMLHCDLYEKRGDDAKG